MLDERTATTRKSAHRTRSATEGPSGTDSERVPTALLLILFSAPLLPCFAFGVQIQLHLVATALCGLLAFAWDRDARRRSVSSQLGRTATAPQRPIVLRPCDLGLFAIVVAALASLPFARSLSGAIAALFPLITLGFGYLLCRRFVRSPRDVEDATLALLLAGAILACFGIRGAIAFEQALADGRALELQRTAWLATPFYPHSYAVAQFLAPCVPLGVAQLFGSPSRKFRIFAILALPCIATYLTLVLSRAMWLGTAAGCVVVALTTLRARRSRRSVILVVLAALVTCTGLAAYFLGGSVFDNVGERIRSLLDPQAATFNFSRLSVWSDSLRLASESMPTGVGLGEFARRFAEIDSSRRFIPHAHQQFLHWFVEIGPLGLVGLAFVILSVGASYLRRLRSSPGEAPSHPATRGLLGAWLTFVLVACTETPLLYSSAALLLAFLLGASRHLGRDRGRKIGIRSKLPLAPSRALRITATTTFVWFIVHSASGLCGMRARSLADRNEHAQAITLASIANTLQPHLDWILWTQAQSERALGRLDDAERTLMRYDALMPRVTAAQMQLATHAFRAGRHEEALERLFATRKRAAPELLVEIDYEIGNCLTYLGRDEEARATYLALIQSGAHVRFPELLRRTADCLARLGRDPTLERNLRAESRTRTGN